MPDTVELHETRITEMDIHVMIDCEQFQDSDASKNNTRMDYAYSKSQESSMKSQETVQSNYDQAVDKVEIESDHVLMYRKNSCINRTI